MAMNPSEYPLKTEERVLFEKKAHERGFSTVSEMIRSLIADDTAHPAK